MVKEIRYTNIRRVLDNLHDHPMLRDVTLEQAVRYTVRFIELHGYTKMFKDKIDQVEIHEFRGVLPCDLISIIQVRDCKSGTCLRSMTDSFTPGLREPMPRHDRRRPNPEGEYHPVGHPFGHPHGHQPYEELTFKTQGRIIYTSFPEGMVEIAYKSIPVDEDGFPLLIDNETYLAALEAYIKKQVFTIKFDQGKIAAGILQNAQTDYAFLSGELQSEFQIPSISEMESITRYVTSLIPRVREFDKAFRHQGDREFIKRQ